MNFPKRHHYLPQVYLNNFTSDDSKFWVYYKDRDIIIPQTPVNTAVITYYYSKDPAIEEYLSKIESWNKRILEKIKSKNLNFSLIEKVHFSVFLSLFKFRVPGFENKTKELSEKFSKKIFKEIFSNDLIGSDLIKKFEKESGKKVGMSPKEMVDFIESCEIVPSRNLSIDLMLKIHLDYSKFLFNMEWNFIYSRDDCSFITTDNPFTLIPPEDYNPSSPYGIGLITPGSIKLFPISYNCCLYIGDVADYRKNIFKIENYDRKENRGINMNLAINSENILISRDKHLLERIIKITRIKELTNKEAILIQ